MQMTILTLVYRESRKSAVPGVARPGVWRSPKSQRHSSPSSASEFWRSMRSMPAAHGMRPPFADQAPNLKQTQGQWRFWKETQDSEPVHTCSAPSLLVVSWFQN
jgi:predicted acyl esterase